jgi:serine/threonine-protein kinase
MTDLLSQIKAAFADRYAIERELGRGASAVVYLANDLKHRRQVAIKVLNQDLARSLDVERFLREIEMAAGLTHPNILPLHDSGSVVGQSAGRTEEFLYYVMPYVAGESLRDKLNREIQLPVEEATEITKSVASALDYAHRHDVIHRDIKPENILLADGHAILADFGIGKAVCDICDDSLTMDGYVLGTPKYMSPEQATGEAVDQRTDIYSLGCVLYEMLTGKAPYGGQNIRAMLARHAITPIPSVCEDRPEVSAALDALVSRAMAKDPDDRFATASELTVVLDEARVGAQTGSHAAGSSAAPGRRFPGRRTALGILAAVVVLSGGLGWWFARPDRSVRPVDSVAVLPFTNLSNDSDQVYFVDGLHYALITELAQVGALTVISQTSVAPFRNTTKGVQEIAAELNVDAVVEGSVLRAGDSVRITVQMVQSRPERQLWAQSYERDVGNVLALQREVVRSIAREIETQLTPQQSAHLSTAPRVDPAALDAYLHGRFYHARGTVEGFQDAIEFFDEATRIEPSFGLAHSARALSIHLLGVHGGGPPQETEPRAKAAAERALELDGELAEARAVLAGVQSMYEWDWEAADREYRRAISTDPNSAIAHQWYAYHLAVMGDLNGALAEARLGQELDPLNPMAPAVVADQLVYAREYEAAKAELERAVQLDPSFDRARDQLLEWIHAFQGRYADAVTVRKDRMRREGQPQDAIAALDAVFASSGPEGYWRWRLDQLHEASTRRYVAPSEFAKNYAMLGDLDSAFEWLERAFNERGGMELLRVWPGYDSLIADPRYADFLERLNFPN